MKKAPLFLFLMAFTLIGFSCGESEEDRMAREQARIDSIRVAEQAALEARMQAVEDSLAAVEAARLVEEVAKTSYTFDEAGLYTIQIGSWRSETKANQIKYYSTKTKNTIHIKKKKIYIYIYIYICVYI